MVDLENPILGTILEGVIDDVEKSLGIGVGEYQILVDILPPITFPILLPYSPVTCIDKLEVYDPISLNIWEESTSICKLRNSIPDQLWFSSSFVYFPRYGLRITYTGGFQILPKEYEMVILRNCLVRWENRQLRSLLDVIPISDERYLQVWK